MVSVIESGYGCWKLPLGTQDGTPHSLHTYIHIYIQQLQYHWLVSHTNTQGSVLSGLLHGLSFECSGVRRSAVQVPHLFPHALETQARGMVAVTGLETDSHLSERDWYRGCGQRPGDGQRRRQQTTQNTSVSTILQFSDSSRNRSRNGGISSSNNGGISCSSSGGSTVELQCQENLRLLCITEMCSIAAG